MDQIFTTKISREKLVLIAENELLILREKAKNFDRLSAGGVLALKCGEKDCPLYGGFGCGDCFSHPKYCREHIAGNLIAKAEIGYSCPGCYSSFSK